MTIRQLGWRVCYELLASRLRVPDWTFMNYGYSPSVDEPLLALDATDEPDRLSIQLYARALGARDLRDQDVLEVGSGRGGGCSYLARSRGPLSMTGLDFSQQAVDLCRRRYASLRFVRGDAQAMPFPDASFDTVINIESSHCYDSVPVFLAEVARVLRPGGVFAFADFRSQAGLDLLRQQLAESPLTVVSTTDITERVVAALAIDDQRKSALIDTYVPRVFHPPFRRFAGMVGSTTYERFATGAARYLTAMLTRSTVAAG